MMRILVTGITGFAGGHLATALLARGGVELFGVSRKGDWPPVWGRLPGKAILRPCDLCRPEDIDAVVRDIQPEQVYHLGGYAHVGQSFREVEAAWAGNLTATLTFYEAVRKWGGRPRIVSVGSGLIYGDSGTPDQTYDEQSPLRPGSPYAASKAAADLAGYQYTRFPGLDIVRARPFNHIGPHQSSQFAVAHFAQQIAAIERGEQPLLLETGNLSPLRDLTDVRDTVKAYILLMKCGRTGEAYNVASGMVHSMQTVLDRLLALAKVKVEVRTQGSLVRTQESAAVRGNAEKLRHETGWAPQYNLDQTLQDTLDYWRQRA